MSKVELATSALKKSLALRRRAGASLVEPINPIDLALKLGLQVRFVDISMEGMYHGGISPVILLSSLRPAGRRNFTCAHEIGHYAFGHGSAIDELQDSVSGTTFQPDEYLADVFAGHLLMPVPGLLRAFADRGTSIESSSPASVLQVASAFGVGFDTLVSHLSATNNLSLPKANALREVGAAGARRQFLGSPVKEHLLLVDEHYSCKTADLEVGNLINLPNDVELSGTLLTFVRSHSSGQLFQAIGPGICRANSQARRWSAFIRISRKSYVGLAAYRHLEEEDE